MTGLQRTIYLRSKNGQKLAAGKKEHHRDLQWLRLCVPSAEEAGSIPGRRTRSHMLKLRVHLCAGSLQSCLTLCMFPAGVIGQMMMLFVGTEQSRGSKSGEEEDGLSFTDVEFEVWGAFR